MRKSPILDLELSQMDFNHQKKEKEKGIPFDGYQPTKNSEVFH